MGYTEDVFDALDIQDDLQTLYTSGTVFHTFLGEKLPDWKAAAALVKKIAENYKLPYYTLSPTYSICKEHGYLAGEQFTCPHCGAKTEVYSRITGYYRPVQNWNDGKTQEFKDRKVYDISRSTLKHSHADCRETEAPRVRAEKKAEKGEQKALLFTTKTCPNCKAAEAVLTQNGVAYSKISAEENAALCEKFGIRQAPTLIVTGRRRHPKICGRRRDHPLCRKRAQRRKNQIRLHLGNICDTLLKSYIRKAARNFLRRLSYFL